MKLGDVAQLGEHLLCKQGVVGSSPIVSTLKRHLGQSRWRFFCAVVFWGEAKIAFKGGFDGDFDGGFSFGSGSWVGSILGFWPRRRGQPLPLVVVSSPSLYSDGPVFRSPRSSSRDSGLDDWASSTDGWAGQLNDLACFGECLN